MINISDVDIESFDQVFCQENLLEILAFHLQSSNEKIKEIIIELLSNLLKNSSSIASQLNEYSTLNLLIKTLNPYSNNISFLNVILNYMIGFFERFDKNIFPQKIYLEIFEHLSALLMNKNYVSELMLDVFCMLRLFQSNLDLDLFEKFMIDSNAINYLYNENYLLDSLLLESFLILTLNIFNKSAFLTKVNKLIY